MKFESEELGVTPIRPITSLKNLIGAYHDIFQEYCWGEIIRSGYSLDRVNLVLETPVEGESNLVVAFIEKDLSGSDVVDDFQKHLDVTLSWVKNYLEKVVSFAGIIPGVNRDLVYSDERNVVLFNFNRGDIHSHAFLRAVYMPVLLREKV